MAFRARSGAKGHGSRRQDWALGTLVTEQSLHCRLYHADLLLEHCLTGSCSQLSALLFCEFGKLSFAETAVLFRDKHGDGNLLLLWPGRLALLAR